MLTFETQVRVRYSETDQMGYVYYGNYAAYYEVARVEMLRSLGTSYKEMEAGRIMMPVLDLTCKYVKPAKYDDLLTIKVSIRNMPSLRMKFDYELFNEKKELINIGATTLVFIDMDKNKPCFPPQDFLNRLAPHFEESR
ncbi:thioesterase family protein [Olivibacter sp. XZL3]|uniref:acyl-CoA thioesterase n=1 Tax=Olivibacter sp. XZL3 TaxID=1735116 RepID=UPI0010664E2B|nr:thioesterase family protein [Olivibacter sp. XZL3]